MATDCLLRCGSKVEITLRRHAKGLDVSHEDFCHCDITAKKERVRVELTVPKCFISTQQQSPSWGVACWNSKKTLDECGLQEFKIDAWIKHVFLRSWRDNSARETGLSDGKTCVLVSLQFLSCSYETLVQVCWYKYSHLLRWSLDYSIANRELSLFSVASHPLFPLVAFRNLLAVA